MADIKTPAERSKNMAAIKGKDTKPEIIVRRFLHHEGFRFRLHRKDLPGKPDLVLPKHKTVIFVHGCFWHRHEGCYYATTPATRQDFWAEKFEGTKVRDKNNQRALMKMGWRVMVVWECGLKHRPQDLTSIVQSINNQSQTSLTQWPELPPKLMSIGSLI